VAGSELCQKIDLDGAEREAIANLVREKVQNTRFPFAPALAPLKSALLKLDPAWAKVVPPLPSGPMVGSRRKPRRWWVVSRYVRYRAYGRVRHVVG
jgi:hypothetical protein